MKSRKRPQMDRCEVVDPNAIYDTHALALALKVADCAIWRAIRRGEMRYSHRCAKNYVLGKWVIEWIESAGKKKAKSVSIANAA